MFDVASRIQTQSRIEFAHSILVSRTCMHGFVGDGVATESERLKGGAMGYKYMGRGGVQVR